MARYIGFGYGTLIGGPQPASLVFSRMRVQFYAQMLGQSAPELCTLEIFSDEIEQLSKMPLEYLVDRMHGTLVCFASRKGEKKPDYNRIRPAISADGEPLIITARNPTLKGLLDAIAEEEFSKDW